MNSTTKEKRMMRKIQELGHNPQCSFCGENEITMLTMIMKNKLKPEIAESIENDEVMLCMDCLRNYKLNNGKKKVPLTEDHHIAGAHEGETIPVSLNAHAFLTDTQLDWPEGVLDKNRTPEMAAIGYFMGMLSILSLMVLWGWQHIMTLYNFVRGVQA